MTPPLPASVIIPTCGRPRLLLDCVASVLRSDITELEIIVVDQDPARTLDGELPARFNADPRIRYVHLDGAGASRARNAGIRHATGELLVFVDDDHEVAPDWLSAYLEAFRVIEPPPGMVAGRIDPLWSAPRPSWLPHEREYLLGLYARGGELRPLPEGDLPMTGNCAVPRRVIDEVGMFDERIGPSVARKTTGMMTGEDSLLSLNVKQSGRRLYYQPRARSWHKIPTERLTRRFFLRRSFWEGVTSLVVSYLSGAVTPHRARAVIWRHIKTSAGQLCAAVVPAQERRRSPSWMLMAATCAYSVGITAAGVRLLLTRKLP